MTTDAKIGLLIGLLFIILISFLINGFPDAFPGGDGTGIIETSVPAGASHSIVIDQAVSDVARRLPDTGLRQTEPPAEAQVVYDFSQQTAPPAVQAAVPQAADQAVSLPPAIETTPPDEQTVRVQPPQNRQTIHIVRKGECLPVIAVKYYGSELGNKHDTVQRLYEVNHGVIPSPDLVRVGDKLKIPSARQLFQPVVSSPDSGSADPKNLLDKFKDLFEPVPSRASANVREYIVQTGDRLWDISEQLLGDGKRYTEIVKLNGIEDPDQVPAGVRLKIPQK